MKKIMFILALLGLYTGLFADMAMPKNASEKNFTKRVYGTGLNQNQIEKIITDVYPDAISNTVISGDVFSGKKIIVYKELKVISNRHNNDAKYVILFSLRDPGSSWSENGVILLGRDNNPISSLREPSRGMAEFEIPDLGCGEGTQIVMRINEGWAAGDSVEKLIIFNVNSKNELIKVIDTYVSVPANSMGNDGEGYVINGEVQYSDCRKKTLKDIIIIKQCAHYDDYFKDGGNRRVELEKRWVRKEVWKFNGKVYKLRSKTGRDPLNRTIWERIKNKVFKSKKRPLMSDKYHGA
ncbi:MAG: hypothetical protein JXR81_03875 [Candidatus Goldbacteria bacterium]|nr:hypothetical protein [Candidatus Goldiibacteriota bacterium]